MKWKRMKGIKEWKERKNKRKKEWKKKRMEGNNEWKKKWKLCLSGRMKEIRKMKDTRKGN